MDAAGGYDETVLGGEWNAHHAEWGNGGVEIAAGRALAQFIREYADLKIVNTTTHIGQKRLS